MDYSIKQSKTYHLARPLHSLPNKNHSHLHSLPAFIREEEASHRVIPALKEENIFVKSGLVHLRRVDLSSQQSYRVVGVREVRSYQSRAEKKKRNLNGMNRKSSDSAVSVSRVSSTKTTKNNFLTKEDLIKKLTCPKMSKRALEDETLMEEKSSFLFSTLPQMETTGTSIKTKQENVAMGQNDYLSKTISLGKVKSIMKKYENEWEGLISRRRKIQKKRPNHKKYQSVLQNVVLFREGMEERQKNDLLERNAHIKPQQWQLILRCNKSLQDYHQQQLSRAIPRGVRVVGVSKSGKELEWLSRKDREGCFFKEMSSQVRRA